VRWIKLSVYRFVIVSIFNPNLRLILILNSFVGSSDSLVFFLLFRPPPRSPLFPYTTLFRSQRKLSCLLAACRGGIRLRRTHHHRSEEHTSELQSPCKLVCRLLLEKKN